MRILLQNPNSMFRENTERQYRLQVGEHSKLRTNVFTISTSSQVTIDDAHKLAKSFHNGLANLLNLPCTGCYTSNGEADASREMPCSQDTQRMHHCGAT